jgi:hypothetical protein
MIFVRPSRAVASAGPALRNITSTCPATSAVDAGAAPVKGTCSISSRACLISASIARWEVLPMPQEAKVILPGDRRTRARKASSVSTPRSGRVISTKGPRAKTVTGVNSVTGL